MLKKTKPAAATAGLVCLVHKMILGCYRNYPSKLIIAQALLEIKKLRGLYAK